MQPSLVLNAQNWAVKQIIDANCDLKFCSKLWRQTVKTVMRIQREDTAVILTK